MLISKFDLYKTGWLDLVFESRNKAYGAYELRQHYAGNLVRAMGITFFGVALLFAANFIFRPQNHTLHGTAVINDPNIHIIKQIVPPKAIKLPKPIKIQKLQPPPQAVQTQQHVELKVVDDHLAKGSPIPNVDLTDATGPETVKGVKTGGYDLQIQDAPVVDTKPAVDDAVQLGADVMPEPDGGMNAWSKFLNRNLRFPVKAEQSGRVILSFVVEKDGHLSNIFVENAAGHGFDEEAVRVLKLAKPWKPGLQIGQPVRVKYTIPINFQLTE